MGGYYPSYSDQQEIFEMFGTSATINSYMVHDTIFDKYETPHYDPLTGYIPEAYLVPENTEIILGPPRMKLDLMQVKHPISKTHILIDRISQKVIGERDRAYKGIKVGRVKVKA